ncbi:MAG: DUF1566 domain-containing protein [Deltaproteobacteria bacterium]|nr:DUF1566 domain-containing protein [Deltaproteobacteria bacterium]
MSFIFFISLIALLAPFFLSNAGIQEISAVSGTGQSLYLYKSYHSLVIGVSAYEKWPKLPNAANDAREVAAKLEEIGFNVHLVIDPSAAEMEDSLNRMVYEMGSDADRAVLLYFAGHGETETLADRTKMGYIIPRDCPLLREDPLGFAKRAVSMRDIETASLRIRARHVIMLFDSCFSGSLFALVRALPRDISEKSVLPVRQYITAGSEKEEVPDRSMFKRCLLLGLDGDADLTGDGYITGSELGMYLSDRVVNYTRSLQHPQYGKINNPDLDRGDFIFVHPRMKRKKAEETAAEKERSAVAETAKQNARQVEDLTAKIKAMEAQMAAMRDMQEKAAAQGAQERIDKAANKARAETAEKDRPVPVEKTETSKKDASRVEDLTAKIKALEAQMAAMRENQQTDAAQGGQERFETASLQTGDQRKKESLLRGEPDKLRAYNIRDMIKKYNFFVTPDNEKGDFPNEFVDNGDGTVTDRATGLMWQQEGSRFDLYYSQAEDLVSDLNEKKFAGHGDWRIPTLEELLSLSEPNRNERGLHLNSLLKSSRYSFWTVDTSTTDTRTTGYCIVHCVIDFETGKILFGRAKALAVDYRFDVFAVMAVRNMTE